MKELKLEEENLQQVIDEYQEYLEDTKLKYENINKLYQDYELAELERKKLDRKINLINKNIVKPYFARIDFENKKENIKDVCYIGKVGLMNYDDKIITVDWRSPIASLYYDSNVGNASYKVDDEIINGNLLLKRQYNIENKKLISFNDVDTVSNDELLKPYLSVNSDNRLKNIVSTIQSEQNKIIRSSISKNLIIQGVAGSGKTTVALHRIAYLVYNFRNYINSNQYMVIGPNKFFINYISSVLPDLDVDDVLEFDLIQFCNDYLDEKIKIKNGYTNNSKYKSSLEFKNKIDEYIMNIYNEVFNNGDLKIKDFILISNNEINNIIKNITIDKYDSLNLLIDKIKLVIEKYLTDNKEKIILKINNYFDKKLLDVNDLNLIRKERTLVLNEFKTRKNYIVKSYFSRNYKRSSVIYKEILKSLNMYENDLYYEDLASLIYINYKIYGSKKYNIIRHIVVDEAQDYNEFTFYALKKVFKNSTFSIYGDLAQSLYPYRSLNKWEDLYKVFDDVEIEYLNKSYRTSIEIMNEANKINRYLKLKEANAVIRHSDNVEYIKTNNLINEVENKINEYINKGLKTIAIISKDDKELKKIYNSLNIKYNITIINDNEDKKINDICLITSNLSKGLEFDGVIISDASEEVYNSDNEHDMKLLYVSMTRAMHNLCIMYKNNLNNILKIA